MDNSQLLLPEADRERVTSFFEPRAAAVDAGEATVPEGLSFLHEQILPRPGEAGPNTDLARVAETIATVASCDMSTAFSLWCHRMVMEYLWLAPAQSPLRTELLPAVERVERLGSTALAAAMARAIGGAPLTVQWREDGSGSVLNGRVNWASNLFKPGFVMITAAAHEDDGRERFFAIPGDAEGLNVDPYPELLALQSTASSSLKLNDVRIPAEHVVSDDFQEFVRHVRPRFLLLQSSFCWGLSYRALLEAAKGVRGVNEVLRPDLEDLESRLADTGRRIRFGLSDLGNTMSRRDFVQLRLDSGQLTVAATGLELKAVGGRGYVRTSDTARRFREATFLPIQAPTEGLLRWELSHSA